MILKGITCARRSYIRLNRNWGVVEFPYMIPLAIAEAGVGTRRIGCIASEFPFYYAFCNFQRRSHCKYVQGCLVYFSFNHRVLKINPCVHHMREVRPLQSTSTSHPHNTNMNKKRKQKDRNQALITLTAHLSPSNLLTTLSISHSSRQTSTSSAGNPFSILTLGST